MVIVKIVGLSYMKLREIAVENQVNWEHIYQKYTHN